MKKLNNYSERKVNQKPYNNSIDYLSKFTTKIMMKLQK